MAIRMLVLAETFSLAVLVYLAAGVLFSIPFLARGAGRIDPSARQGTWGFRVIVVPGVIALWPLLLWRWIRGTGRPEERNAHRRAARDAS